MYNTFMDFRAIKKKSIKVLFCVVISLIFVKTLLNPGLLSFDDTTFHINRLQGIVNAFEDGQILTKIYPYSNNGYGYPLSLFYCDLFLYPFAIIYKLGCPIVISYKIMIIIYSFLASLSIMLFSSKIFVNKRYAPYITTVLYTFNNYRFSDVYLRGAVGEILSFIVIPFVLYEMYRIFYKKENSYAALGVSFGLLVLCHNVTFIIYVYFFLIFYILFVSINITDKRIILQQTKNILLAVAIAIGISSFYVFPMIEQLLDKELFLTKYGFYSLVTGEPIEVVKYLSNSITSIAKEDRSNMGLFLIISPLLYLLCQKKNINLTLLYIVLLYFGFCFIVKIPTITELINKAGVIQYRWRTNVFLFPVLSICTTYCLVNISKKIIPVIYLCFVFFSIIINICAVDRLYKKAVLNNIDDYATHDEIFNIKLMEGDGRLFNAIELSGVEYLPDINYDYLHNNGYICSAEGYRIEELLDNNNSYIEYDRHGTHINFSYNLEEPTNLTVPLTYYKGYKAYAITEENKLVQLSASREEARGLVIFKGVLGNATYYVYYEGTIIQKISLIVSFLTCIYFVVRYIISYRNTRVYN